MTTPSDPKFTAIIGLGGGGGGPNRGPAGAIGPQGAMGSQGATGVRGMTGPSSLGWSGGSGSMQMGLTGPGGPYAEPIWRKLEPGLLSNDELLQAFRITFGDDQDKIRTELERRLESFPLPPEVIARKIHDD